VTLKGHALFLVKSACIPTEHNEVNRSAFRQEASKGFDKSKFHGVFLTIVYVTDSMARIGNRDRLK
jgi:hypothetical protein